MSERLEHLITLYEQYPFLGRRVSYLKTLLSKNPDAEMIRSWVIAHSLPKKPVNGLVGYADGPEVYYFEGIEPLSPAPFQAEEWELKINQLAICFDEFPEPKEWVMASSKQRKRHIDKVSKLAFALAEAMEEEPHLGYSDPTRFYDWERAREFVDVAEAPVVDMVSNTEELHDFLRSYDGDRFKHVEISNDGGLMRSKQLLDRIDLSRIWRGGGQTVPSLLRNLGFFAMMQGEMEVELKRPNVAGADARLFATTLAEQCFRRYFDLVPNDVIAACVALRFPGLDSFPEESDIRKWRGVK